MDYKLEVVVIPVTDIDRAKSFYLDKLGLKLDADTTPAENFRVVHMTPPGSACSVVVGPKVVGADADLGAQAGDRAGYHTGRGRRGRCNRGSGTRDHADRSRGGTRRAVSRGGVAQPPAGDDAVSCTGRRRDRKAADRATLDLRRQQHRGSHNHRNFTA